MTRSAGAPGPTSRQATIWPAPSRAGQAPEGRECCKRAACNAKTCGSWRRLGRGRVRQLGRTAACARRTGLVVGANRPGFGVTAVITAQAIVVERKSTFMRSVQRRTGTSVGRTMAIARAPSSVCRRRSNPTSSAGRRSGGGASRCGATGGGASCSGSSWKCQLCQRSRQQPGHRRVRGQGHGRMQERDERRAHHRDCFSRATVAPCRRGSGRSRTRSPAAAAPAHRAASRRPATA